jgi:hypothetical protein
MDGRAMNGLFASFSFAWTIEIRYMILYYEARFIFLVECLSRIYLST